MNSQAIGTMLGCSGGIEPEFALSYIRKTDNLADYYNMYCKSVKEYWEVTEADRNDALPEYFITSKDIEWKNRLITQSVIQKYVDTAISSTVNLPKETTLDDIEQLYLQAWKLKIKGVTIFRDGCKKSGILTTNDKQNCIENLDLDNNKLPWGTVVGVNSDLVGIKSKLRNGCGNFHLQLFYDEKTGRPWETFISLGDGGGKLFTASHM